MNREKFDVVIAKKQTSYKSLADAIGVDLSTFYRKMNGETQFTLGEAVKLKKFLGLSNRLANSIFLDENVA